MRTKILVVTVLSLGLASCQGDRESDSANGEPGGSEASDSDAPDSQTSGADGGTLGYETSADETSDESGPTADAGSGDGSDDAEDSGTTTAAGDTGEPAIIEVLNPQAAASAINGDSLVISQYTAPADGILVVRGGAAGPVVQSVTFDGEALTSVASHEEPDYWFAISADMYWIPVTAGQTGDIAWDYTPGDWTTRRRGMIAVTISGVDQVHALTTSSDGLGTNEGRTGPATAELELTTTQDAVILSAFTSNGPGPSDLTGFGHTVDAFPTVPIEEFHSTRVYGGHALASAGTFTVGYQNSETGGWFDYILFVAAFSSSE